MLEAFREGVAAHGGEVSDTYDDRGCLYVRSVLPQVDDVRSGDAMQAGVAMKATEREVCVYPYTFRLVCKNGAILAQTLESRRLTEIDVLEPVAVLDSIRETAEACCSKDLFAKTIKSMRRSCDSSFDQILQCMAFISSHSLQKHFPIIMRALIDGGDRSRFGMANAVTAVAREVKDPGERWEMEELGGAIAVGFVPQRPLHNRRNVAARSRHLAEVGT
jgi:hypothetical protein